MGTDLQAFLSNNLENWLMRTDGKSDKEVLQGKLVQEELLVGTGYYLWGDFVLPLSR